MTLFPTKTTKYGAVGLQSFIYCTVIYAGLLLLAVMIQCLFRPSRPVRGVLLTFYSLGIMSTLVGWSMLQSFQYVAFPITFFSAFAFCIPSAAMMAMLSHEQGAEIVFRRGVSNLSTDPTGNNDGATKCNTDGGAVLMVAVCVAENHDLPSTVSEPRTPATILAAPLTPQTPQTATMFVEEQNVSFSREQQYCDEGHKKVEDCHSVSHDSDGEQKATTTPAVKKSTEPSSTESDTPPGLCHPEGLMYCGKVGSTCPPLRTYIAILRQNSVQFCFFLVFFFLANLILHITTYGGCNCFAPNEYSTWASRSTQTPICNDNEPCHAYHLVGRNCSNLNSVVHWVGSNSPKHDTLEVKVCLGGLSVEDKATCTSSVVSHRTRIQAQVPVPGDSRYVVHATTDGLQGDTLYTFFYTLSDGGPNHTIAKVVRTLPCGNAKNISFVGGGDYNSGTVGLQLINNAMQHSHSTAYFFYIGGDLAYANNLRFCYRRLDEFLKQVTNVKRYDGGSLPLLTVVGNHEGGGYGLFKTKKDREEGFHFYTLYFPAFADTDEKAAKIQQPSSSADPDPFYQNGDHTATYHRHIIGSTGWIMLDSNIIFTIDEQLEWFNASMREFSTLIDNGKLTKIIVSYHNPAFPSVRDFDHATPKAMREKVVPIMDAHWPKVPWVLENHDHAYKRTKPLLHGKAIPRDSDALSSDRGIIYSGDGSLGVSSRDVNHRWYHDKTKSGNYALAATLLSASDPSHRLVHVAAVDNDAKVIDHFFV